MNLKRLLDNFDYKNRSIKFIRSIGSNIVKWTKANVYSTFDTRDNFHINVIFAIIALNDCCYKYVDSIKCRLFI